MLMDPATLVEYLPVLLAGARDHARAHAFHADRRLRHCLAGGACPQCRATRARWFAQSFVFFFRGAPILVILYLVYYGLAAGSRHQGDPVWFLIARPMPIAILALSLNSAGFLTEIIAGALRNVPAGEVEAARAFGLTGFRPSSGSSPPMRRGWRYGPMAMSRCSS